MQDPSYFSIDRNFMMNWHAVLLNLFILLVLWCIHIIGCSIWHIPANYMNTSKHQQKETDSRELHVSSSDLLKSTTDLAPVWRLAYVRSLTIFTKTYLFTWTLDQTKEQFEFELSSVEIDIFSEGSTSSIHGEHLLVKKLPTVFKERYGSIPKRVFVIALCTRSPLIPCSTHPLTTVSRCSQAFLGLESPSLWCISSPDSWLTSDSPTSFSPWSSLEANTCTSGPPERKENSGAQYMREPAGRISSCFVISMKLLGLYRVPSGCTSSAPMIRPDTKISPRIHPNECISCWPGVSWN